MGKGRSRKHQRPSQPNQGHAANPNAQSNQETPFISEGPIRSVVSTNPHGDGGDNGDNGSFQFRNRWRDPNTYIAIGTIVLVFVGLGALYIAHDSEVRQLRAYVEIQPTGIQDFAPNQRPTAGVQATILGQTPAYDFTLVTHIAALPYPLNTDIRKTPSPKVDGITRTTLAPGQHASNAPTLLYAPTPDQFRLFSSKGPYRLYVWGTAKYRDAFKIRRKTRFCYSYPSSNGLETNQSEPCLVGNCADDQCSR